MLNAQIIGLGRSGIAAARILKQEGCQVTLSDSASAESIASRNTSESLHQQQQALSQEGITVKLGYSLTLDASELPQLIVVSPGVPWDLPVLIEARNQGIDTIGELELAWRHLQSCPWVGITGTNGKTTTTALIAAIFQAAGFDAPACGNIGYADCELALESKVKTQNSGLFNPKSKIRNPKFPRLGDCRNQQLPNRILTRPCAQNWRLDDLYPRPPQPSQDPRKLLQHQSATPATVSTASV